jgi:hypothetical protein
MSSMTKKNTSQQERFTSEAQPLLSIQRAISVDDGEEPKELQRNPSVKDDIIDILSLGFPIFLSSLSWVGVSLNESIINAAAI